MVDRVVEEFVKVNSNFSSGRDPRYVLSSNIYAASGRWLWQPKEFTSAFCSFKG